MDALAADDGAVAAQRRDRARVQRDLPGLAELATPDGEQPLLGVEVATVQADRLADPQPFSRGSQPVV